MAELVTKLARYAEGLSMVEWAVWLVFGGAAGLILFFLVPKFTGIFENHKKIVGPLAFGILGAGVMLDYGSQLPSGLNMACWAITGGFGIYGLVFLVQPIWAKVNTNHLTRAVASFAMCAILLLLVSLLQESKAISDSASRPVAENVSDRYATARKVLGVGAGAFFVVGMTSILLNWKRNRAPATQTP